MVGFHQLGNPSHNVPDMGPREWFERSDEGPMTTPHPETYREVGHDSANDEQTPEADQDMGESGDVSNEVTGPVQLPPGISGPIAQELIATRAWAAEARTRLQDMREQLAEHDRRAAAAEQRATDATARAAAYARIADQATRETRRMAHHLALHHDRGVQSYHRRTAGRRSPAIGRGDGPSA